MSVLVVRPGEQGKELGSLLEKVGIDAIHHPVVTILPGHELPHLTAQLHSVDIVIAVSQHAVTFAQQYLTQQSLIKHDVAHWPSQTSYFAIGKTTADTLHTVCSLPVQHPEQSDSEHLLELDDLQNITGKKILILRGNGGRETLYQTLQERGACVHYLESYRREPLPFQSNVCIPLWQKRNVQSIVITSSQQLHLFMSHIQPAYQTWLLGRTLLVPSQRIQTDAKALGFSHIINTRSAANSDLLAAIRNQ